jgi:hypothetical protein
MRLLLPAIIACAFYYFLTPATTPAIVHSTPAQPELPSALSRQQLQAREAKLFCRKNNLDTNTCFLIDMAIGCGEKRFFVIDFNKNTQLAAGLVTHGYGNSSYNSIRFSNMPGSHSTAAGRYKTGAAYFGRFGLAYKLHGLDSSNSNAYARNIVLHAHPCVPDTAVMQGSICMSQGCPTVSPLFLTTLKKHIEKASAPVLLWIYN